MLLPRVIRRNEEEAPGPGSPPASSPTDILPLAAARGTATRGWEKAKLRAPTRAMKVGRTTVAAEAGASPSTRRPASWSVCPSGPGSSLPGGALPEPVPATDPSESSAACMLGAPFATSPPPPPSPSSAAGSVARSTSVATATSSPAPSSGPLVWAALASSSASPSAAVSRSRSSSTHPPPSSRGDPLAPSATAPDNRAKEEHSDR